MTELSKATAVSLRADDLRIVLFGSPAAGKSSLLGALSQAAQTQEHVLNGRINDVSHGLDELRQRLYQGNLDRTAEEVVPYPVDFTWFDPEEGDAKTLLPIGVTFFDCDGRAADDLLMRQQALAEDSPQGVLARAVRRADTLVLVLDVSASPVQMEAHFAEVEHFLQQMEIDRGRRFEISGLPIFLVLSKCDLLAQPGDTTADWIERIEQHKRDLFRRFQDFLERRTVSSLGENGEGLPPFGGIDLHVWATAVKRPALAGSSISAREPYGVAELFRQCLEQASTFRRRCRQAARRLVWTIAAAGGVVVLIAFLAVHFAIHNLDTPLNAFRQRVQIWRSADMPTESERLHAPLRELRRRAEELREIRSDPRFDALSAEQRRLVCDRLDELEAYLHYFDRLVQAPRPREVHSVKALLQIQQELKTELALPNASWKETEAGRLQADRLQDAEGLAAAVKRAEDWYRDSAAKAEQLRTFSGQQPEGGTAGINWDRWTVQVETLLRPDFRPPFSGSSPVPGAATTLTYEATVLRFDEVLMARIDWEEKKNRLQRVLDLCTALGLAAPAALASGREERGSGVLAIPRHFTLSQASERRNQLELFYPNYKRDFVFKNIPEAIRPVVDQAAHTSYERLLAPAQAVVLKQLEQGGGASEALSQWENVRRWLREPKELESWRVLAGVLIRLHDPAGPHAPAAADPVSGLAEFLNRKHFTLNIRRLTLEVPESLEHKPAAEAFFSIYHPASAGDKPALVLQPVGEGERDPQRRVWTYSFRLDEGQRLTYRPGDVLWATLPLRDGWMLTWTDGRSSMYQFDRLMQPPRLHQSKESATNGTREEEVHLAIIPADGVPRLPDLFPIVKLLP